MYWNGHTPGRYGQGDRSSIGRSGAVLTTRIGRTASLCRRGALYATRRIGAATAIALVTLVAHAPIVMLFRLYLPPGPIIASHVLLLVTAVALDVWYGLRSIGEAASRQTQVMLWGVLLYAAVFFAVALPYIAGVMTVPVLNLTTTLTSMATGLPRS
jgi:hypothetical protein